MNLINYRDFSVRELFKLAKGGLFSSPDTLAQLELGKRHFEGDGVSKDSREAVTWFRRSAENGNSEAQYCLGYAYLNGLGVVKDNKEAEHWYSLANNQGHSHAKLALAQLLDGQPVESFQIRIDEDVGTPPSVTEWQTPYSIKYANPALNSSGISGAARKILSDGSNGGAVEQFSCGAMYSKGELLQRDDKEAARWYRRVILMSLWPSSSRTVLRSTPAMTSLLAK